MNRVKSYVISVPPVPWQRARLHGKRFYDAQTNDKLVFGIYLEQQHDNEPVFNRPVAIDLQFFLPYPTVIHNKAKYEYHANRPDLDNLCKFVLDSIKGILISDDRIVYSITAKKMYDSKPRTLITITEVPCNG